MKQTVFFYAFLLTICLITACSNDNIDGEWLIDRNAIQRGEGKGDIPAINEPKFLPVKEIEFLSDTSLVIGIKVSDEIKAYPLSILNWHEIVNDEIGDSLIAITYATLSGSGIAFERRRTNNQLPFKLIVSGLLYNSNLIANDDLGDNAWLQFERRAVNGLIIDQGTGEEKLKEFPVVEMNWGAWRLLFPNSQVLTTNTGFNRPYQTYPYGDYRSDTTELFDLTVPLETLPRPIPYKEKGLGVILGEDAKVYPMSIFPEEGHRIIHDEFRGVPLVIIGSREKDLIVAYNRERADGSISNFSISDPTMLIIKDENGQEFNVLGETIDLVSDEDLKPVTSNIAYWFSWPAFFSNVEIYE